VFVYNKVSSVMGRDDSWAAIFTVQFIIESDSDGRTVLPIANLVSDSASGSPDSYSNFLVTIRLSRLVSEMCVTDRRTDGQRGPLLDHYYSWPHITLH